MTWDPRDWSGSLSTRQYRALFLVGLILGSVVLPQAVSALAAYLSNSGQVSGGVTFRAASGPAVNVTGTTDVNMTNPYPDNQTVRLRTSDGNITFSASAHVNATIAASEINGSWTNVTGLDVTGANLTINPDDKQQVVVGGDADTLKYKDTMTVGDGTTDFVYSGASGTTTLKLYGLPADTYVGLYDPATGDILAGGQTTSNGVLVVETPNSKHTVELVGTSGDPEFVDGTASPTGGQSTTPDYLTVNVTDPDFPSDTVNVTFYLDGSKVGTDTLEDAGEANVTISRNLTGSEHDWYAVAEDEYGQTTQSVTHEFTIPNELYFYNESNPTELLDNTTITATIYAGDQVFNRTVSDGSIDLSGLPADTELIVTASADGFYDRHVVLETLAEQQRVYMLPDSNVSAVEVRFKIKDKTGEWPPKSTEVIIKRPITRNNSTEYEVVASDEAGVNGYIVFLEESIRYRIIVRNDDGQTRILGPYTASVSETVTLTIGQLEFGAQPANDAYQWDASYHNTSNGRQVKFNYSDPLNATQNLRVVIYERGNRSNNTIYDQTHDGPFGALSVTKLIPDSQDETTWVVSWSASRNGSRIQGKRVVGPNSGDFEMALAPMWKHVASVGLLIVFAGLFGGVSATLGGGVVAVMGGFFWYIRWLPAEVGAGAVVLALAVAAFRAISNPRGV